MTTSYLPARNPDQCILTENPGFGFRLFRLTLKSAIIAAFLASFSAAIIINIALLMVGAINFIIDPSQYHHLLASSALWVKLAAVPFMFLYIIIVETLVLLIGAVPLSVITIIPNFVLLVVLATQWKSEDAKAIGEGRITTAGQYHGVAVYLCFLAVLAIPFFPAILNGTANTQTITIAACAAMIPAAFRTGIYTVRELTKLLEQRHP